MTEVMVATRSSVSPGPGLVTKARIPSRTSATWPHVDIFGLIAMLCGAGLIVALLLAANGLDLSIGIF
jgi:hypothetical protein